MCMAVDGHYIYVHLEQMQFQIKAQMAKLVVRKTKKERKTSCPLGILRVLVVGIGIHSFFYKNIEAQICEILGIF